MVLVTGATGLVGAHLIYRLLEEGRAVRALKRQTSDLSLVRRVFRFYSGDEALLSKVAWMDGDLLDIYSLYEALEGVKQVYHCAAMVSFNPKFAQEMVRINEEGTANLVNLCLKSNVEKFCFVSSIGALGKAFNGGLIDESCYWQPGQKHSLYSNTKYRSEMEVWRASKEGLNVVIVNPSIIIGVGDWNRGSSKIFGTVSRGMKYFTSGVVGFVDVQDVVKGMILLMESGICNERFVLSGDNISYQKLLTLVAESLCLTPPAKEAPLRLMNILWRLDKVRCSLFGKEPLMTRETVRTSQSKSYYSSRKMIDRFNFEFTSIERAVADVGAFLLKEQRN